MNILWHITCLLLLRSCAPGFFIHGVVGGKESVPHSRPYMVYICDIRDNITKHRCGGVLIREDYVMTTGHCIRRNLMVYLGIHDTKHLPDGVEVHPIPHPRNDPNKPGHDIMLLKLKTPATLNTTVSTIPLPKPENEAISKDCMVMGWGLTKYKEISISNVLREANVTLLDSENCIMNDTLCNEGPPGPAQGDAGGPLVCGGVAQGVVSFYTNHNNAEYLTVYTHISPYLSWIHHIMSPDVSVPHSRPYMVYIHDKVSKVACGGVLIREDFVMTAAHCKQSHLVVYLGVDDTNLLSDGVEVDPYPHPNFTKREKGHDIMLLKLKTPVTLNKNVSTITLPKTKNEEISKDCMVMGWGWKKYDHESPSNVLREANVTLLDSENCGMADTLCNKGPPGPAQGDSGGPLVCGGVVWGIVSFSKEMGNVDQLRIYTPTSRFLTWIHDIMSPVIPKMLAQSKVFCLVPKTQ